jgi:hypothetical protein
MCKANEDSNRRVTKEGPNDLHGRTAGIGERSTRASIEQI